MVAVGVPAPAVVEGIVAVGGGGGGGLVDAGGAGGSVVFWYLWDNTD